MENAAIARLLAEIADMCEIRGDNSFRIRAFRNAAAAIETLPFDVAPLCSDPKRLCEIQGIGRGIADKIVEICTTGSCDEYRRLAAEFPPSLLELIQLQGVGTKKARQFYDALGIRTMAELEAAARAGKLRNLPRMSAKLEEKILAAITAHASRSGRFLLSTAERVVSQLVDLLRELPGVRRIEPAGSFRRRRDTIGDLDLLVACERPEPVMDRFCQIGESVARGETKCSVRLSSGIQADLRIVPEESFGAALHYFTGSKEHNVALRTMAVKRGLTINEYGVYEARPDGSPGRLIGSAEESDVFAAVDLPWIPPELRENRGEIEAAQQNRLPRLIELDAIRGDVHMHTTATDGKPTIEEMAAAATELGRQYIAITEHSKALAMTRGLDEVRLVEHCRAIDAAEQRLGSRIRLLRGIEVDILRDGSLDLASDALAALDVVVASVHSHFNLTREEMTARLVRAIESGSVDIIGHPTGRVLLRRDGYPLDMEAVMQASLRHGVAMELSAYPDRLDLSDTHCRMAKQMGVKLVINTDSHATSHLELMRFGVATARRAWLEPADVLNTLGVDDFLKRLHEGHR